MGAGLAGLAKHFFNLGGTGATEYITGFRAERTAAIKADLIE